MTLPPTFETVAVALARAGLAARGGFHPSEGDGVPPLPSGMPVATLVLSGNFGDAMWRRFSSDCPVESSDNAMHPAALDDWSRRTLNEVAAAFGGPGHCSVLFPFTGPPFLPFAHWAQRSEAVFPSPIGPLVHPEYGLWHAYRGALAFAGRIDLPPRDKRESPCLKCDDKPCLKACPVGAHSEQGFDLGACINRIAAPSGVDCMTGGCLARGACPIGREHAYGRDQVRFHMVSFRRSNGPGGSLT